ncbi:unnamed protein product [Chrysoparadoxa australica]
MALATERPMQHPAAPSNSLVNSDSNSNSNSSSVNVKKKKPEAPDVLHRRQWKTYHQRQEHIREVQQYKRKVFVDETVWGQADREMVMLWVEELRKRPVYLTRGGAAEQYERRHEADGTVLPRELLNLPTMEFQAEESYLPEKLGARANFVQVIQAAGWGPSPAACGPAWERAQLKREEHESLGGLRRNSLMLAVEEKARAGNEALLGAAASVLAVLPQKRDRLVEEELLPKAKPQIGPLVHSCSIGHLDELEAERIKRDHPSTSDLIGDRLVMPSGLESLKLRGRAKSERDAAKQVNSSVVGKLAVRSFERKYLRLGRVQRALAAVEEEMPWVDTGPIMAPNHKPSLSYEYLAPEDPKKTKVLLGSEELQRNYLIGALEAGDTAALSQLLELGLDPWMPFFPRDKRSKSVLQHFWGHVLKVDAGREMCTAPSTEHLSAVLALLLPAAMPFDKPRAYDAGRNGYHLLHHAAAYGNLSKLRMILDAGIAPDLPTQAKRGQETALVIAAKKGTLPHIQVAAFLLQRGASLEDESVIDSDGRTPLHHAALKGRKHMCQFLLMAGVDKDVRDNEGSLASDLAGEKFPRVFAAISDFRREEVTSSQLLNVLEGRSGHNSGTGSLGSWDLASLQPDHQSIGSRSFLSESSASRCAATVAQRAAGGAGRLARTPCDDQVTDAVTAAKGLAPLTDRSDMSGISAMGMHLPVSHWPGPLLTGRTYTSGVSGMSQLTLGHELEQVAARAEGDRQVLRSRCGSRARSRRAARRRLREG